MSQSLLRFETCRRSKSTTHLRTWPTGISNSGSASGAHRPAVCRCRSARTSCRRTGRSLCSPPTGTVPSCFRVQHVSWVRKTASPLSGPHIVIRAHPFFDQNVPRPPPPGDEAAGRHGEAREDDPRHDEQVRRDPAAHGVALAAFGRHPVATSGGGPEAAKSNAASRNRELTAATLVYRGTPVTSTRSCGGRSAPASCDSA